MNNAKLDQIDKSFDKFSWCPIVVNGAGRALYGTAELVAGFVSSIWFGIALACCTQKYEQYCEEKFDAACLHMFFGSANIVKGILEAIPIVNWLVCAYNTEGPPLYRKNWEIFTTTTAQVANINPPAQVPGV